MASSLELECLVCLEIPEVKIFQCHEGHIICELCYPRLDPFVCPMCRMELDLNPIRNRALERIVKEAPIFNIKLPRVNAENVAHPSDSDEVFIFHFISE